jgi:nucleotide-binding universal stress UspA family protein
VAASDDEIIVLHASAPSASLGYESMAGIQPVPLEQVPDDYLDHALDDVADSRVSSRTTSGHAGIALVEVAEEIGNDVTVVVGHGGSSKASLLLGSIAQYVVHHNDSPVVVVRGDSRVPVRRLVVGVDQGDEDDEPDDRSLAALRWAVRLPGVERIEVSHADFVPGVAAGPLREPGLESAEEVEDDDAMLQNAIEEATDGSGVAPNGATIVPVVAAGTGAFALIEASREADLIVIGTRGRSGLVELIVGSTGLDVLAHAHCPVAVVR